MSLEITIQATDAALARLEKRRMVEPDELPNEGPLFSDLAIDEQRSMIRDHLCKFYCDKGLIGEAINQVLVIDRILEAFFANDKDEVARLFDVAVRDYIGAEIQRLWDEERR